MSKRRAGTAIPLPEPARPMRRRTEVLVGGIAPELAVRMAVVTSGKLDVPGTTHPSAVRVALFATIGGILSVVLAARGRQLRRR